MNCKLEEQKEQELRQRIIYSVARDYGTPKTALMCGLREDQTDLVYKYGNNPGFNIPNKRWRMLSQGLSTEGDLRIVREYADPSILVSLFQPGNLNGCYKDELLNIMSLVGKISEECSKDKIDQKVLCDLIESLSKEGATMKHEVTK